jgi:hypothetical protein
MGVKRPVGVTALGGGFNLSTQPVIQAVRPSSAEPLRACRPPTYPFPWLAAWRCYGEQFRAKLHLSSPSFTEASAVRRHTARLTRWSC